MGKPKKLIFLRAPSSRLRRVTVGPILGGSPEPGKLKHEGQKKQKMLARVTHISSAMPEATKYFSDVLEVAKNLGDPELLVSAYYSTGNALYCQGHFGKAEPLFRQAITRFEQLGDWARWIRAVSLHGGILATTGSYAEGLAACQRALARAHELNALDGIAFSTLCLSWIYAIAGNLASNRETSRRATETFEHSGDRAFVYLLYLFRSYSEVCAGQFEAAAESIAKSQTIVQDLGGKLFAGDIFGSFSAEVALGKGQIEQALSMAEQAVAIAGR